MVPGCPHARLKKKKKKREKEREGEEGEVEEENGGVRKRYTYKSCRGCCHSLSRVLSPLLGTPPVMK
jgi:hypothetical protein